MGAPDGLTVSVSQLKEYLTCPRRYELHRVRGVEPAFVPLPLALGTAIHAGLAAHYLALQMRGEIAAIEEVLQAFRDAWAVTTTSSVHVDLCDDGEEPVSTGIRALSAFHRHALGLGFVQVEAVERAFSGVVVHDPVTGEPLDEHLTGVVDLILREGERRVVVEHKSASRRWTADQLEFDFQSTAYRVAARQLGLGEVGLRYQVITKARLPVVQIEDVDRDEHAEVDFMRLAAGILRAIGAGAFWPQRGWQCKACPYAHACRQ